MFDIEYKGGNTVTIATKKIEIVFDPKLSVVGLKDLNIKDAVQIATEERFLVPGSNYRLAIEGPGEYELADVSIRGIATTRHIDDLSLAPAGTIYQLEIGGVRIVIMGNAAPKLSEDQLEAIGVVDIVVIPVGGGGYTLDATSAASAIRQLEPKVVIPIHYADKAVSYEVPQDTLETFTSELAAPIESVGGKYKVKSPSSLPQTLTVIVLDRTS